ncbi:MAG: Hpt domain-containing protein [Polyangiales bacterium]
MRRHPRSRVGTAVSRNRAATRTGVRSASHYSASIHADRLLRHPASRTLGAVAGGLEERLAKLREGYAAKMTEKLDVLETAVRTVVSRRATPEEVDLLWGAAHKLAGTAGSYGFQQIGEVVQEMETLVGPFRSLGDLPRPVCDGLVLLLEEARRLSRTV